MITHAYIRSRNAKVWRIIHDNICAFLSLGLSFICSPWIMKSNSISSNWYIYWDEDFSIFTKSARICSKKVAIFHVKNSRRIEALKAFLQFLRNMKAFQFSTFYFRFVLSMISQLLLRWFSTQAHAYVSDNLLLCPYEIRVWVRVGGSATQTFRSWRKSDRHSRLYRNQSTLNCTGEEKCIDSSMRHTT